MQRIELGLLQTFHSRKCDSIVATSVIETEKFASFICVDTRKYIGKNNTQGNQSIMYVNAGV